MMILTILKIISALGLCALIGSTYYFDKNNNPFWGGISFLSLIVYTMGAAYFWQQ
ncbi:MAG: hypothetical protein HQ594_03585 [Candidatus Omnitrophica bacterium]|nr:hypothetical protein [Candidatus Omnitrophota bacterium]